METKEDTMKKARAAGFSLMELLIVVIIVGILASVALPQFNRMARKARAAEAADIVGAILTAEWVMFNETGAFVAYANNAAINAAPPAGQPALGVQVPDSAVSRYEFVVSTPGGAAVNCRVVATADAIPAAGSAGYLNPAIVVTGDIANNGTRAVVTTTP